MRTKRCPWSSFVARPTIADRHDIEKADHDADWVYVLATTVVAVECLFVGAGDIATQYAALTTDSQLSPTGVCDLNAERAAALAEKHDAQAFDDIEEALERIDAPLVVNLTNQAAHAAVTEKALSAGRHVYSQKPLALEADTAAALLATAERESLGLACAPMSHRYPAQRLTARLLAEGRLGRVGIGYAHAHVGRVTDWHHRPEAFLDVGPLYDGGVYPLTLLVAWFGPVREVRSADLLDVWPDREPGQPETSHVEATLSFADGPKVRLVASMYTPHRSREFYGLELHGDDGSVYLDGAGTMTATTDTVQFCRAGREYTSVPPQTPNRSCTYLDAVERFATAVAAGKSPKTNARRGAHVVAVCNAIEQAAREERSVAVPAHGTAKEPITAPPVRPVRDSENDGRKRALRLPPIGFGCSRYRDGEYVERVDSIATALDAGYRLLDSAELYGNEHRIGELLAAPGAPDRDNVFVLGKVWRTNHRHSYLLEACAGSRTALGIGAFDCYALHWPEAWSHRGRLARLAEKPIHEQEALTFPENDAGEIETADVSLEEAWANLETVYERGWARTLGVCNVSREQLDKILDTGSVSPALVQIERHPYQPRLDLVSYCHEHGIRVVAHSPLSATDLLEEEVIRNIATKHDLSPAGVVLAWNVTQGVVPIPSSIDSEHVVENLEAGGVRLTAKECARIEGLQDSDR